MVSYLAHDKASGLAHDGGLSACLRWSVARVESNQSSIIAIIKARPGEDARVIAEADKSGLRWVFGGRYVPKREVSKLTRRADHG